MHIKVNSVWGFSGFQNIFKYSSFLKLTQLKENYFSCCFILQKVQKTAQLHMLDIHALGLCKTTYFMNYSWVAWMTSES